MQAPTSCAASSAGRPTRTRSSVCGCHHDSQGALGFPPPITCPGANDNASAEAIFIELARYYRANGCPKTLWFVSFGGEERNLILSRDFVRTLNESGQLNHVIAYIGIDQAANGDVFRLLSSADEAHLKPRLNLRAILKEVADELQLSDRFQTWGPAPVHAASDHWPFYFAGVPAFLTGWHPFPGYHRSGDNVAYCHDDAKFSSDDAPHGGNDRSRMPIAKARSGRAEDHRWTCHDQRGCRCAISLPQLDFFGRLVGHHSERIGDRI